MTPKKYPQNFHTLKILFFSEIPQIIEMSTPLTYKRAYQSTPGPWGQAKAPFLFACNRKTVLQSWVVLHVFLSSAHLFSNSSFSKLPFERQIVLMF